MHIQRHQTNWGSVLSVYGIQKNPPKSIFDVDKTVILENKIPTRIYNQIYVALTRQKIKGMLTWLLGAHPSVD
jgi:hypothetical protein